MERLRSAVQVLAERGQRGRRQAWFGILISSVVAGSAVGNPTLGDTYRDVFERLLQDPNNVELNLRYAQLAIKNGELRKALAAYERVLEKHPGNRPARAGLVRVRQLLKPNYTEINAVFGGQYESNPLRFSKRVENEHDGVFFGRVSAIDERRLGRYRWRTGGDVFANYHLNIHRLDFGFVAAETGPVLPLGTQWQMHTFVGGGYAWLDSRSFQSTGGAGITFEPVAPGILRSITVKGEYNFIGSHFSERDSYIVDVSARLVKMGLFHRRGIGTLTPYYRYNGVTGDGPPTVGPEGGLYPLIFHQVGGRADYFYNLPFNVTLNANVTLEYQHYFEPVLFGTEHRRDLLVAPGAQVIVAGLVRGRADLIFSYRFEYNSSNDGYQRYTNHIAGVRVLWRIR